MPKIQERVLVVENDPIICDFFVSQVLKPGNILVDTAGDVSTAMAHVLKSGPDMIFADLDLPGLSGKDLLAALLAQGIDTPVVALARSGQGEDIIRAFRLGAADYIIWPAREAEVVAVVERVLRQVRERREGITLSLQVEKTNRELQQRVRELTTIFSIGKAVTSITDQNLLFDKILEDTARITSADLGWFLLREDASKPFILVGQRNLPLSLAERVNQPWEDGISSLVGMSGESLSIHGEPLQRFKLLSLGAAALVVPVKVRKQVIGLLTVMRRKDKPFSEGEQHLVEAIADYASVSLVNARLFRAVEERAQMLQSHVENTRVGALVAADILRAMRDELRPGLENARQSLERIIKDPTIHWSDGQRQALSVIREQQLMMSQVLDATQPDALVPAASTRQSVDLVKLARQTARRLQRFAAQNSITIAEDAPGEPILIRSEQTQMTAVLDALVSNAIKFSKPGGHVTIRIENHPGQLAHLVVSNTGPGLAPRQAEAIFEPDADRERVNRFGGLGIRLNLVKEIICLHRGKIWVESKPGTGVDFHISLPLAR